MRIAVLLYLSLRIPKNIKTLLTTAAIGIHQDIEAITLLHQHHIRWRGILPTGVCHDKVKVETQDFDRSRLALRFCSLL